RVAGLFLREIARRLFTQPYRKDTIPLIFWIVCLVLSFENSTWCTPLDVMIFRGSIALNRPLVGSLDACVRPRTAPRPLCAESRARSHRPATPATASTESIARQWSA